LPQHYNWNVLILSIKTKKGDWMAKTKKPKKVTKKKMTSSKSAKKKNICEFC